MVGATPDLTEAPDAPPSDAEPVDPEHRTYQAVSGRGPALVILGIAVFILLAGVLASALVTGSSPTESLHSVTIPGGTVVPLTPATSALHSIVSSGQPPADILGNLAVPAGSSVRSTLNSDQDSGQFDRTVSFTSGTLAPPQLVDAFHNLLPKLGWQVIYVGAGTRSGSGTEVLAKRGSGDGFYWEVGVVVSPTTAAGITPYSVELFQLPDDEN
jgi:uncharacterized membrane protein YgcG